MKTLDEVIRDCEEKLGVGGEDAIENCLETDALHYLKEYKAHKEEILAEQDELCAFHSWLKEWEKDKLPLTEKELAQMEGKPVWVEPAKEWMFVTEVDGESGQIWMLSQDGLTYDLSFAMDHGWKAYRKELK